MRTVHFIGGEKGGVGKSWVARTMVQYFLDGGNPEVDPSVPLLHLRFNPSIGSNPEMVGSLQSQC